MRFAAVCTLILALATSGDARHQPPHTSPKARVRLIIDTNFGDALLRQYERLLPNVQIEQTNIVGSVATVNAIQQGTADLGFAFADVAYFGYQRVARESPTTTQVRGIAALEVVPMHVLARSGLVAQTLHDLVHYRVGVGTALSGQSLLASLLFKAYGLGPQIVQPDRRPDLLAGVDATIATAYYPAPTVTDAMDRGGRLIPIDGPVAAELRREYPFLRSVTIPADSYPGQHADIATLGVERLLIASSRLDETLAHDLTRVFIETLPQMAASLHTSIRLTNLEKASATPIPLHEGAAQYYRERELTR